MTEATEARPARRKPIPEYWIVVGVVVALAASIGMFLGLIPVPF